MIYKTHAIIISSNEIKEFDRFYNILSAEKGKKQIIAKGVRKITAKLACGLEPITHSEIFLAEGRSFDRVTGVIINNQFNNIKKDLAKIREVRKFFKIINWLLIEKTLDEKENEKLFEGLLFYLKELDKKENNVDKIQILKLAILWKIINWLGFQPQIFNCANCYEKLKEENFYQMVLPSGTICEKCFKNLRIVSQPQRITKETLKILRIYNQKEFKTILKIKLSFQQLSEIKRLTIVAIGHILGRMVDL